MINYIMNNINIDELKQNFKKNHSNIILENDLVLYNDNYIPILLSKHITIKLNTNNTINKIITQKNDICPEDLGNCGLSHYDIEKISLTNSYTKTISYFTKNTSLLQEKFRKISIYDKTYLPLFETKYLLKKYNLNKKTNIIYIPKENKKNILLSNLKDYNIITNLNNIEDLLKESCIFNIAAKFSNYNMNTHIKVFSIIYNSIIKLENNNNTFIIRIFPLFLTKLTFQLIDILKSYFEEAYLVKPKYDFSVSFYLVLKNKNKKFDKEHLFNSQENILSISDKPINDIYKDFFDILVNKLNNILHIYYSLLRLKSNSYDNYKIIIDQISNYRKYYFFFKLQN